MQTQIKLKESKLPRMLGDLSHSNQYLKIFSLSSLFINLLSLIVIFVLSTQAPVVLSFNTGGSLLEPTAIPKPELEIQAAIKHYLELRYQWGPENVKEKLNQAQEMIHPSAMKAYLGAAQNVVRFSSEKQVSQRVYGKGFDVDFQHKTVRVTGDRITSIQNLKAAGDLKLELAFDFGPRTKENPWGVFITREVEAQ